MNHVKEALYRFLAPSVQPKTHRTRPLSRQDILTLVATNKLTTAQARAVLEKRFQER